MTTCNRCNATTGVSPGRTTCNRCRRPPKGAQPTQYAPRPPAAILAAQREAAQRQARAAELAGMAEHVTQLEAQVEALKALRSGKPMPDIVPAPKKVSKSEVVPLVLLSDWHVEQRVESSKVHGLNEYTLAIAKRRSEICFESASKLIAAAEKSSKVGRVFVGLLGDFITGHLREENLETNQLAPGPAVAYAKELLSRGIRHWLSQHKGLSFDFFCTGGNHGRLTPKTRISTIAEQNLEVLMFGFLAQDFADEPRVRFHIATGDMLYGEVFPGYKVRFMHGDAVSYQGGVGGLGVPMNRWIMRQNQLVSAEISVMGHWHQLKSDRYWLTNGSLIGLDTYAQRFGFDPEPPQQAFALIHATRGRVSTSSIWCT